MTSSTWLHLSIKTNSKLIEMNCKSIDHHRIPCFFFGCLLFRSLFFRLLFLQTLFLWSFLLFALEFQISTKWILLDPKFCTQKWSKWMVRVETLNWGWCGICGRDLARYQFRSESVDIPPLQTHFSLLFFFLPELLPQTESSVHPEVVELLVLLEDNQQQLLLHCSP